MSKAYFLTFARYNAWANRRLYDACAALGEAERRAPRRAFFGSIHATLNHLLVGDRIWLGRIVEAPVSLRLDQILFDDFAELRAAREAEDKRLIEIVEGIDAARLDAPLHYANTRGVPFTTPLRLVLGHIFNHQTHHRGQVHDMLSQTAVEPPELDLIIYIRQAELAG
jgi:uncharacterized damage-inducible protein DinB